MLRISKKVYLLVIVFMLSVIVGGSFLFSKTISVQAEEGSANEILIADLNRQIEEQRKKIDEVADKIDEYKDNIKQVRNESATLQNQVYILNNQIAKTDLDVEAKEEKIKTTELEIEKVELEIDENQKIIEGDKEKLGAFIRRLDIYDQKSYLSVLLSNDSFSEFFDQIKYLENVEEDLQKTLNRVQEYLAKLGDQKTELNDSRDQLSELLSKLEQQQSVLESQKGTKTYLVQETRNSERRFQGLIEDLKQAQLEASNAVAGMERQLRAELEKRGAQEKFNSFGDASLNWPARYPITAYFHDPEYPYRYLFEHSGLDLATPMGTPIRAAEAGYVARVSRGTKWYGNYIMVIHNNNLATLYAHLNSINVSADQYVSQGQVMGASGTSGFSSGPHLHFEVRLNGIPVNPLSYLP